MTSEQSFPLTITIADRASMDDRLNAAVSAAKAEALGEKRHGILVTRHSMDRFTIALTDTVPFGVTKEHRVY